MKTIFFLLVLFSIFSVTYSADAVATKYAVGSDVVIASIRRVQDTCIFANDLLFMRRVAFQESNDGNDLSSAWTTEKGRAGIWQTRNSIFFQMQNSTDPMIESQRMALSNQLQVNVTELDWDSGDLEVPLNSLSISRMFVSSLNRPIPYGLNEQADYWAQYYKDPANPAKAQDFINNAKKMKKCKPPGMDLVFIMDSSGSIGEADFEHARSFMISVINSSNTDQVNRFGIVRFSDNAVSILNLTSDLDAAINASETMFYNQGGTNIQSGLDMANGMFARDGRIEVPMVALLITDGDWNEGSDPGPSALDIKSLGVNLFTIGVGKEATQALKIWATSPSCMFYYSLNGYSQLATVFPELLNSQICDVSAVAPENQTALAGSVDKDQSLFYQISANLSAGITIKLDIHNGAATVYVSLTSRLPSAADYDYAVNATTENLGQIYISPDDLKNANKSSFLLMSDMMAMGKADITVYTAIVGLLDATNFTLHYEPDDTVEIFTTTMEPSTMEPSSSSTPPTPPSPSPTSATTKKTLPTILNLLLFFTFFYQIFN